MLGLCDHRIVYEYGDETWFVVDSRRKYFVKFEHFSLQWSLPLTLCGRCANVCGLYGMTELVVTISMGRGKRVMMNGMLLDERACALRPEEAAKALATVGRARKLRPMRLSQPLLVIESYRLSSGGIVENSSNECCRHDSSRPT